MKTTLAAIALAATLAQPATAITFPSLTTIYVATNVVDDGGALNTGTATTFACSNVSGQTADIRFMVLDPSATNVGDIVITLSHGGTTRVSTHFIAFLSDVSLDTGQLLGGTLNIESTQSGVFCHAAIVDAAATTTPNAIPLHLIRVNPHPGTVE